jgi:hypothetical protein
MWSTFRYQVERWEAGDRRTTTGLAAWDLWHRPPAVGLYWGGLGGAAPPLAPDATLLASGTTPIGLLPRRWALVRHESVARAARMSEGQTFPHRPLPLTGDEWRLALAHPADRATVGEQR